MKISALKPTYANHSSSSGFIAFWFILPHSSLNSCINKMDTILQDYQDQIKPFGKPPGIKHFVIAQTSQIFSTLLISWLPKYNNNQPCLQVRDLAYNGLCQTN